MGTGTKSAPVLAIDARFLATGIGRYTEQLVQGIRETLQDVELWCIGHPRDTHGLQKNSDRVIPCSAPMYSPAAQIAIPAMVRGAKLLHCPHYDVPVMYRAALTVTIHDITHLLDPAFRYSMKAQLFARSMLRVAAMKAQKVITISQYSKRMIVEHLGADERNIEVIYRFASPIFIPMPSKEARYVVKNELGLDREYFLFVGSPKPHKNLPVLFEALALLRSRRKDVPQLVVIGKDEKNEPSLRELATRLGINDEICWIERVSDPLLRACYSAAEALILPSRQEGFGLPVLESMACGTPVVCADAASLPEIAGGCGLFFDPSSAEECCEQLSRIIESTELRKELKRKGLDRAKAFDGAKAVREHARLFSEILYES